MKEIIGKLDSLKLKVYVMQKTLLRDWEAIYIYIYIYNVCSKYSSLKYG